MEIFKKTIRSGNASAVVLPKAWLNKKVKIELVDQDQYSILQEVLDIVKSEIDIQEIIGIYLVGSYAREDYSENSDIDVLVISEKTDRKVIKKGSYEIMIVSVNLLNYKLRENLFPVGAMLKEAKPLLNSSFLKEIKIAVTKKNTRWYLETTKEKLRLIKNSIDTIKEKKPDGKLSDLIAYSLVLRLRTLYIIHCLIENKPYRKDKFVKLVKDISGSSIAYDRYVYAKSNEDYQRKLIVNEAEKLYEYLKKQLIEIKQLVENIKK